MYSAGEGLLAARVPALSRLLPAGRLQGEESQAQGDSLYPSALKSDSPLWISELRKFLVVAPCSSFFHFWKKRWKYFLSGFTVVHMLNGSGSPKPCFPSFQGQINYLMLAPWSCSRSILQTSVIVLSANCGLP